MFIFQPIPLLQTHNRWNPFLCSCAQGNIITPILVNTSQKSVTLFTHPSSQGVTILDVFDGEFF
jgi:hypothetical protein